jgi:hypothetical protein
MACCYHRIQFDNGENTTNAVLSKEVCIYKLQDTGEGGGVLEACFQNMTPVFTLPKTTPEFPDSVVLQYNKFPVACEMSIPPCAVMSCHNTNLIKISVFGSLATDKRSTADQGGYNMYTHVLAIL